MASITRKCKECKHEQQIEVYAGNQIICPQCGHFWGKMVPFDKVFETCVICQCKQFYMQKDFHQLLGCAVVFVGILLVPATYGLSLPLMAALDWILYKQVMNMAVCYRCGAEYRGFKIPGHLKPFMHHIGMKYDKNRMD